MSAFKVPPRGLLRLVLRAPRWLYSVRLGWLLGERLLLLEHSGRRSGRPRRTVLEVVHRDAVSRTYYVASGWGERAQWFRNVQRAPAVTVTVGTKRFRATARRLSQEEAAAVLRGYGERHRVAGRFMRRLFGSDDPAALARALPVVALERARATTPGSP